MSEPDPPSPAPPPSGLFVAVGHQGLRMTSADGIEWRRAELGKEGQVFRAVACGAGRIVAVGSFGGANVFASSADGVQWETSSRDAKYSFYVRGLGYGRQMFLGLGGDPGSVGDSKPFVVTSGDGREWTEAKFISGKNLLRRIAWGNERFVAVGDRGRRATSLDGLAWTDAPDVKAIDTLIDVAFGAGRFVGVGLHGLRMTSEDGAAWSGRLLGEEGEHINSVLWTGERFVAIGQGATYLSPDGLHWERAANKNAPLTAVYGQGQFLGANWRGRILLSADAIDWRDVYQAEQHVEAIAFGAVG